MSTGGSFGFSRRNISPVLLLNINKEPADKLLRSLVSFTHKRSIKKGSEAVFVFRNDSMLHMADPRFRINVKWEYRYGYLQDLSPLLTGEVQMIEPVYDVRRTVTVTLRDATVKLTRSSEGKNWGRVPSSDIAIALARKHGIVPRVDPSNDIPEQDFIQPANINDLEYLRDLAKDIDYELFIDGYPPTLTFRKRNTGGVSPFIITYRIDPTASAFVQSFKPKIKAPKDKKTGSSKMGKGNGKGKTSVVKTAAASVPLYGTGESWNGDELQSGVDKVFKPFTTKTFDPSSWDDWQVPMGDRFKLAPGGTFVDTVDWSGAGIENVIAEIEFREGKPFMPRDEQGNLGCFESGDASSPRDTKPVVKPVASSGNTGQIAKSRAAQVQDAAQEATSVHSMTPSFELGKYYVWAGLDGDLNSKWYTDEITCTISGNSQQTTVSWKRTDPNEKKGGPGGSSSSGKGRGNDLDRARAALAIAQYTSAFAENSAIVATYVVAEQVTDAIHNEVHPESFDAYVVEPGAQGGSGAGHY